MTNLQSLIKDILAHSEGHSVTIYLENYVGSTDVSRRISHDKNLSFVDIYVNKTTDICAMHYWSNNKTTVGFSVALEDTGFDFNPAIEEATRLWKEFSETIK